MNKIDDTKTLLKTWHDLGVKIDNLHQAHADFFTDIQGVFDGVISRRFTKEEANGKVDWIMERYDEIKRQRDDLVNTVSRIELLWKRSGLGMPDNFNEMREAAKATKELDLDPLIERLKEVIAIKYLFSQTKNEVED